MSVFQFSIVVLLLLQAVLFYCLFRGPTYSDRLVVVNAIGSKANVMVVLVGILFERVDMFVDVALAFALLTLVGTLALSHFLDSEEV